jgi:CheY-like chemotaxis protein
MMPELTPVRHRTLLGICRKLMAPGLYRDQEMDGRRVLKRLLKRAEKPFALEVIISVLLTARMCDQDIEPGIRAIIAVADIGTNPKDYPVEVFEEPFDYDLRDADEIAALVENLVRAPTGEVLSTDSQTNA